MKVEKMIHICSIKMDNYPLNPSTLNLIDFIRNGGEVPAIRISKMSNGQFKIKDGRHRLTAYKLLGRKEILAKFDTIPEKF